jgi:hypothetical protein
MTHCITALADLSRDFGRHWRGSFAHPTFDLVGDHPHEKGRGCSNHEGDGPDGEHAVLLPHSETLGYRCVMRRIAVVLACAVPLSILLTIQTGCGGGGGSACDSKKCDNDPKPSIGVQQQCRDIQKGSCGSLYNDERSCLSDHYQCTGDGHLDPSSQVAALAACEAKTKAYQDCVMMQPGGDGGP